MTRILLLACCSLALPALAAEYLDDPTRPPLFIEQLESDDTPSGGLVLSAILVSPERSLAVINGASVGAGDEVAGARVVEIRPWGVILKDDGDELELRLSRRTVTSAAPPSEEP